MEGVPTNIPGHVSCLQQYIGRMSLESKRSCNRIHKLSRLTPCDAAIPRSISSKLMLLASSSREAASWLVIFVTPCSVFRAKLSLLPSPSRLADDAMSLMSLFELADRFNEPRIRFLNESTLFKRRNNIPSILFCVQSPHLHQ